MATTNVGTADIFAANPYESHPSLSPIEAEVLWEYAKLAQNVKQLTQKTRKLGEAPDELLVTRLRILEKKMGPVLTHFKTSVWGVINEMQAAEPSYSADDSANDRTIRRL